MAWFLVLGFSRIHSRLRHYVVVSIEYRWRSWSRQARFRQGAINMLRMITVLAVASMVLTTASAEDRKAVEVTVAGGQFERPKRTALWTTPRRSRLFQNQYAPSPSGATAQLYPAPIQVPAVVGQSHYSYEPLMPHEFLYSHQRTYYRYYDGGRGMTRTRVLWTRMPIAPPITNFFW